MSPDIEESILAVYIEYAIQSSGPLNKSGIHARGSLLPLRCLLLDAVRFRRTDLHGGSEPAAHRRRSEGFDGLKL
jgi:hypothetical protein